MTRNPSGAIHPTVFMLAWGLASVVLHALWPIDLPQPVWLRVAIGVLMAFTVLLFVWTQVLFWRHGTTTDHSRRTTTLIVHGPFRLSRNPIYLSLVLTLVGASLSWGNLLGLILVVPFAVAVHVRTILPEERDLEEVFGSEYRDYRRRVRRWL